MRFEAEHQRRKPSQQLVLVFACNPRDDAQHERSLHYLPYVRPRRFARQGNHVLRQLPDLCRPDTKCPGKHKHNSWAPRIVNGRPHYPTKAEAAYPALLCQRIAALVRHHCCPDSLPPPIHGPASSELRCAMDKQSRKAAPLVEEYSSMDLQAIPWMTLHVYSSSSGSRVTQR